MRIKLTLDYIGTAYHGWQRQDGLDTVQERVEAAVYALTGQRSAVVASGRTDKGVHALAQVAHLDTDKALPPIKWRDGLNHYLPGDIRILDAAPVPETFHAIKNAKKKTYRYYMYGGASDRAVYRDRAVRVYGHMDIAAMDAAAKAFLGRHDFAAFKSMGSAVKTTVRTVYDARVFEENGLTVFSVTADGFLYNMVRLMAGVLMDAGKGRLKAADIAALIDKKDKTVVHYVASAHGLYLYAVEYE
ncbi:MAG: tRNA pseudouridine(38-40) synthase TruA [Clostridiales bacterium]|jgi:tRNA pseudouridine38-40 synthase|nr:tRNA pseudouridine(38-40) synthase TruA [Clostridiales bacterium]